MGVLRMSRFQNSFIYGAFGKVGNFSDIGIQFGKKFSNRFGNNRKTSGTARQQKQTKNT